MLSVPYARTNSTQRITAEMIGIPRSRWVSAPEDTSATEAAERMKENGFDVVPIETPATEVVTSYFSTDVWGNYASVSRKSISYGDTLPQSAALHTVINVMAERECRHLFLRQHNRITGFLSIVHLNTRPVRVYLFGLLSELEVGLSNLVQEHLNSGHLTTESVLKNVKDSVGERYSKDKRKGADRQLTEYLHLSDLVKIIRKGDLQGALGYPSKKQFEGAFNSLVALRNRVAHPVRTLVRSPKGIDKLSERLETVYRGLFRLERWAPDMV